MPPNRTTPAQAEQIVNAQERAEAYRREFEKRMVELQKREWCIDQAVKACGPQAEAPALIFDPSVAVQSGMPQTVKFATVQMAREMFKFMTEPFADLYRHDNDTET